MLSNVFAENYWEWNAHVARQTTLVERCSGVDMMSKISYVLGRFELDGMFTVIQINLLQCIAKNQQ